MTDLYRLLYRQTTHTLLLLVAVALFSTALHAQERVTIENEFSSVVITKEQQSGRFWFATGSQFGYTRYTYNGGGPATVITTNVVFRFRRNGGYKYYCNTVDPFANGGDRPASSNGAVPFAPYDSIYVSPGNDTCAVVWKDLERYQVIMRFVAEAPRHEFDDGADILLEFEYEQLSGGPQAASDFGIFLMIDGDNGTIKNGVASDQSSALTDRGYYPSDERGALFQNAFGGIPEYCMIGWFEYTDPLNDVYPVHRLTGTSLGGASLSTPEIYAIGNWKDFRKLSWEVNSDVTSKQVGDVATCMRWNNLGAFGTVRTAFGTTSKAGNNLYHCRDSNVFVVMRTERLVKQGVVNGPYSPAQFNVEMWTTSLRRRETISPLFQLRTPIRSFPNGDRRVRLDPSTPATIPQDLQPRQTKKTTWTLNVNQSSMDSEVELELLYRDTALVETKPLVPLLDGCSPLITFRSAFIPDPPDDRPPVIQSVDNGRDQTAWWTFRTFDRHPGYRFDSGLDRIEIVRNDGNNFQLIVSPDPFDRCDTNVTVNLRAQVIDTTKAGTIVFRVYDCEGLWTEGAANYSSRPDIFKPEVSHIDSVGRFDLTNYPCATPTFEVYVEDRNNQTVEAGDAGFGSVEVLNSVNFDPIQINFDQGEVPIGQFDETATFRLIVTDVLFPANAEVRVADLAGNADTLIFEYCTLPDSLPPLVNVNPGGGTPGQSWTIAASDERDWDRGLAEVVEIANTNMRVTPWPVVIAPGQPSVNGILVEVIDDAADASLTLEFRDTYYDAARPATHANHSERVDLEFFGIPDTLAPNISFLRDVSVPVDQVVYTVAVNDTHFVAGNFYEYDRGLEVVQWNLTANMRIRTPLAFTDNRRGATFQVEIIDPLAIVDGDTICVTAIDSAGNASPAGTCLAWPNIPDGKSPIFTGRLNPDRLTITGTVRDDREYDRGLGSVELRGSVNLQPYSQLGLAGIAIAPVAINVIDPEQPIAGELVIRDFVGVLDSSPEQSIHTVVIPFSLQTAALDLVLPEIVEGGEEIVAKVVVGNSFDGDQVEQLEFQVQYSANGQYLNGIAGPTAGSFTVVPSVPSGRLTVIAATKPGQAYQQGDVLGTLNFGTEHPYNYEKFSLAIVPGSLLANDGVERTISVRTTGDPLASELTLPVPFFRMAADSQTVINGECNRALTSDQSLSRANGLAILGLYPQPVGSASGDGLRLLVRDIAEEGSALELIRLDGTSALRLDLSSITEGRVSEYSLSLPETLERGMYFLRITGSTGADQVKVMVVD